MIYLFSSTTREQYASDALTVLALPPLSVFHFRYGQDYVDASLARNPSQSLDAYQAMLATLCGMEALVVSVQQPDNRDVRIHESNDGQIHFYPLRAGKVRSIVPDGKVVHIYFEIGQYVNWNERSVVDFDSSVRRALNNNRPPQKYLVCGQPMEEIVFSESEDSALAWQRIVDALAVRHDYERALFYRVDGFRQIVSKSGFTFLKRSQAQLDGTAGSKNINVHDIMPLESGFELQSSGLYTLDLSFYLPENVQHPVLGSQIVPVVNPDLFAYTPSPIGVDFRYDRASIHLAPKEVQAETYTRLTVSVIAGSPDHEQQAEDQAITLRAPHIDFMIRLRHPRWYWAVIVLLFAAQIMIGAPAAITGITSGDAGKIALGLTSLVGAVASSISLYILVRRLPGQ